MDEYHHWKNRFEIHINGVDTNLWMMIENGYQKVLSEDGTPVLVSLLSEQQRKDYDLEKKAYAILSQAISREIFHQFRQFTSSKSLWVALEQRHEGNASLKAINAKAIKKEFDNFMYIGNESLDDLFERFYHLMSELHAHEIKTTKEEKVQCMADALPPKWDSFLMVLKQNNTLETIDINEFLQKLREQEVMNKWKLKRGVQAQDPSLYYSTSTQQNAPLQTAFVSNMSNVSASQSSTAHALVSSSSVPQQGNTASTPPPSPIKLQTDNFDKVTIEVAKEHMALLSTVVNSYDSLVAGQVGNSHLTAEDYAQIDKDEMDRIDIMWALASAVRRARDYVKRTGKTLEGNKDTTYGFDLSAVVCFNCGEKGHFARQCEKPKQTGNRNPFNNRQSQPKPQNQNTETNLVPVTLAQDKDTSSGTKAMVVQTDETVDWSFKFEADGSSGDRAYMAKAVEINEESDSDAEREIASESSSDEDDTSSNSSGFTAENEEKSSVVSSSQSTADVDDNNSSSESTCSCAFMVKTSTGIQVNSDSFESESESQPCLICDELEKKVETLKRKKNAGFGYKNCPPPVLNTMVNTPDDNPIIDFKCVDGMVEEWDEDDDECPTRGLGHKNSSAPQNDSIGISKSASENVFKIKQTNCRPSHPTTSDQKSQVTKSSIKKVNFVKAGESVQSNKSLSSAELKEAKAGGSKTHQSENQYRSPRLVERRYCFECGIQGHVVVNCPYLQKPSKRVNHFPENKQKFLKSKSNSFTQQQVHQKKVKQKMHDLLVSDSSSTPVQIVKQSTVYHKQSLHKQHVWKAKSDDASDDCTSKSNGCSKSPQVQWMDCTVIDETGKPKTVVLYNPISNNWIIDSGASRHMTGNLALLFDVRNIKGGYVSFAGDKCGFISAQGTLSNGAVSFEKVNFVKQLDNNLLSVSQICDKEFKVLFDDKHCYILKKEFMIPEDMVVMSAPRVNDLYILDMSQASSSVSTASCFVSKATEKDSILWHKRMGHLSLRKMNHLVHKNLVEGVTVKSFHLPDVCVSCKKGKQTKKSHKHKSQHSITIPLELLHMDLFGPINRKSIAGDLYCLVVTDEYSRYSWVMFLKEKSETFEYVEILITKLESLYKLKVRRIRSDNGTEFKNHLMETFCQKLGIHHEFSAPYVPQMNGVAERKNRTLIEAARTMLADSNLPVQFWNEAIANACYTLNRVLVVKRHDKTCFELLHRRKPNLQYLEPFGAPCTMLKKDAHGKFNEKVEEGYFLGYSTPNKRVYNKASGNVEEWYHVDVQKYTSPAAGKGLPWMFDYEELFASFNLPPECSDEEVAVQMMYDAQNAPDEHVQPTPSSADIPESSNNTQVTQDDDSSSSSEYEGSRQEIDQVIEDPSHDVVQLSDDVSHSVAIEQSITNLDQTVEVPAHPVGRIDRIHPQ
ncbi:hypothetical protein L1987_40450 [Smallanthus sonchifolius]|uniref:Uncharacterized protein n=1 Tax=Smallanthus sonchifolius TaxID=185202 RepID=A0ACB9GVA0_9ASTR|nr:hypothetical protein L1987_40450 [Smallanthus sonchifolius]